eukprot:7393386-Pyramimonas_sp.AAC.1
MGPVCEPIARGVRAYTRHASQSQEGRGHIPGARMGPVCEPIARGVRAYRCAAPPAAGCGGSGSRSSRWRRG